jgi:two-component system, cell cycle response regulator
MSGRILVVDDIFANVKLLEARLTAEYFSVITAMNGQAALDICAKGDCDLVLLDVMMPGMDGFEVCRKIKSDPRTSHLPVVFVTALDQPSDRVKGLEAGADDFLTKPFNEVALLARVRSLLRLKMLTDELRARTATSIALGLPDVERESQNDPGTGGRVLYVDDRANQAQRHADILAAQQNVTVASDGEGAVAQAVEMDADLVIVSLALETFDPLRLCSQIRANETTRHLPILVIADTEDQPRVLKALEIGVNDYLGRPVERNELLARTRTQVRRRRYADQLRSSMQSTMEMALIDPLTGLNNRRYFTSHLTSLLGHAGSTRGDMTLLVLDIDHFKQINDNYGHDAGDEVLVEFARRMKLNVRGFDLVCRLGGEEFVIVMPDTDPERGFRIADRIRTSVGTVPFVVGGGTHQIDVTVSVGMTGLRGEDVAVEALLKRADEMLYKAKRDGRNRVIADAA